MIGFRFYRPVLLSLLLLFLVPALAAGTTDRQDMEISIGAGAWVPTGIDFDTELGAGPGFRAGIQIPMSLGNVIYLHAGYLSAGTDTPGYEGVTCEVVYVTLHVMWLDAELRVTCRLSNAWPGLSRVCAAEYYPDTRGSWIYYPRAVPGRVCVPVGFHVVKADWPACLTE